MQSTKKQKQCNAIKLNTFSSRISSSRTSTLKKQPWLLLLLVGINPLEVQTCVLIIYLLYHFRNLGFAKAGFVWAKYWNWQSQTSIPDWTRLSSIILTNSGFFPQNENSFEWNPTTGIAKKIDTLPQHDLNLRSNWDVRQWWVITMVDVGLKLYKMPWEEALP